ncbi:DMT family transporter [Desulfosediminicola ganghwensis]|uniref:DMT family transporter n=1 Tax=Desulfosediminicola ganghwensis TaxID=2569540 RepID=UPI001E574ECA|nr:DMT family transporter [Desulfosediminicola ganghwensis]
MNYITKDLDRGNSSLTVVFGWLAVFCSAFFFYLATVIIRWAEPHTDIETSYFVFARFLLGFIVVCVFLLIRRERVKPRNYHYLVGRTVANSVAVFCFYKAVEVGTVAEANILNMTYPLFVALFSWFVLKKQRDYVAMIVVVIAFIGIYLVLSPGTADGRVGSWWGMCSGITAAAAMIYLNVSRRHHDSQTILFFMFGLGSLFIFILFRDAIFWPDREALYYLFLCSLAGVLGQYLLTYGFLFVTAVEGSIVSSSRVLIAAVMGPLLVGDPSLTGAGWLGALLIFGSNSLVALRKQPVKSNRG